MYSKTIVILDRNDWIRINLLHNWMKFIFATTHEMPKEGQYLPTLPLQNPKVPKVPKVQRGT